MLLTGERAQECLGGPVDYRLLWGAILMIQAKEMENLQVSVPFGFGNVESRFDSSRESV
jgi:hypothetical protein